MSSKLNWLSPKITLSESDHCGWGQVAIEDIQKDEVIVVFGGHVMTMEEFYSLPAKIQEFPYQISEEPDLVFGPANFDELQHGEFFNHSCDPNTGFKSALHLVAMRNIRAGDAITFDYAMCTTGDFGNMNCHCEVQGCRKYITGDDWKISLLQDRYRGYFQPYIEDKINKLLNRNIF
jgi:SET domain-containing protein